MSEGPQPERHDNEISLLAYVQDKIDTRYTAHAAVHDSEYRERMVALQGVVDRAMAADAATREALSGRIDALIQRVDRDAEAHREVHLLAQQAIDLANAAQAVRFGSVNEFRGQLTDQAATFATRDYVDTRIGPMSETVNRRLNVLENRSANVDGRMAMLGGVLAVAIVLLEVGLRFLGK